MTQPSPAVLRQYAEELRDLARTHEGRAPSVRTLLDPVTKLADEDTWTGTFARDTEGTFTTWDTRLGRVADACVEDARRWRRLADDLDDRADTAEAEAKAEEDGDG